MAQATNSSTPINTPIRIGSFHGTHSSNIAINAGPSRQHDGQSSDPQPSSVPSVMQSHMQSQSSLANAGVSTQSSNHPVASAGTAGFAGSNLTPPSSANRQTTTGGITHWGSDNREKYDGNQTDKTPTTDTSKLNRKESYKAQRKNYRREKKRVASELLNSLQDPAVIVLADWLKIRGSLKSWTKLWCVLKPGLMLIYKSPKTKSSHWVGTVLLSSCQIIERPSKKDGFCFKLFHPMEQSIWAPRGPDKETIGAVIQPLPTSYLIFRAPSQAAGKCWMDALELSLRCTALLLRSNSNSGAVHDASIVDTAQISHETQWSEADYEKHFNEQDFDNDSQNEVANPVLSGADSDTDSELAEAECELQRRQPVDLPETPYVPLAEGEFGQTGEQVEELAEENKSLIWCLVKQVRPGMDLSKVVLPTFILEPRSFLDKLSDSYYHADILSKAALEDDPFTRMKTVVQWYLSGFYKKPKGLKKPYNPILGETFRCYWEHPGGSRTFYIAEQVSHHPPISAFYVTNRQDGYSISCSILAKSKFYGNSTSAVLEGVATLTLLPRGETYTMTTPYAHCKGILLGTLSMELGGKINIDCENTGYKTELEFKLRPFLGGNDNINGVSGKIKLGKETLATINGHWDTEMRIKESKSNEETILFSVNRETKSKRLTRYVVPLDAQLPNESERLWRLVSEAIKNDDQIAATQEKTVLEEEQRRATKERKEHYTEWMPHHFQQDPLTGEWIYKYADLRPWDPRNDLKQYEAAYKVLTKTRHEAPLVRTSSVISSDILKAKRRNKNIVKLTSDVLPSDSSQSIDNNVIQKPLSSRSIKRVLSAIDQMNKTLEAQTKQLNQIQSKLDRMQFAPLSSSDSSINTIAQWTRDNMRSGTIVPAVMYTLIGLSVVYFLRYILK